ncbi:hypothetical protein [Haloarcula sp. CBA1122]|uniref:hypothetical protein n=1 Tax=Haloarcula sp. CBA1122 TaxID=2668069 RepID=UPI0013081AE4|nr:hypothetical protein [Haloarcula sp. CBA1122]MUV49290.1 hypothetical protein [Haloarcula sp. CBA1122]
MSERVANVLESYDFFGKSIPGIVALIGIATILPGLPLGAFSDPNGTLNLTVLTALALTLVFSGLVFGQAVHTIADNTEKALYRIGKWAADEYYVRGPIISEDWWEKHGKCEEYYSKMQPWLERRYWGIHDVFKSHRRLFENELGWNFDISVEKRGLDGTNISYDRFRECCESEFDVDIARFDKKASRGIELNGYVELRQLYPMVTATLSSKGSGRANGFQARYSFCRGMWVTLLLLFMTYLLVLFSPVSPSFLMYEPLVLQTLTKSELGLLMWAMFFLVLAFMDASGDYKKHYIEYLISDFCVVVDENANQGKDKEETLKQYEQEELVSRPYYR